MADIDFGLLTIPTPEPFDKTQPEKQRENLAYIVMQILQQAQANGWTLKELIYPDHAVFGAELETLWLNQQAMIQEQSNFANYIVGLSNPYWLTLTLFSVNYMERIVNENDALLLMTATRENYLYRQHVIHAHDQAIQSMLLFAISGHVAEVKSAVNGVDIPGIPDFTAVLEEMRDHIADLKYNGQQVTYSGKDFKMTIDMLGQYVQT